MTPHLIEYPGHGGRVIAHSNCIVRSADEDPYVVITIGDGDGPAMGSLHLPEEAAREFWLGLGDVLGREVYYERAKAIVGERARVEDIIALARFLAGEPSS